VRDKGCVVGDVVQHSLRPTDIPDGTYRELASEAGDWWPAPWRDAVLDCIDRRAVIGTPITEYVPDRIAHGRLALVGDAAHVPTPMTGMGFDASLQDAEALAQCLASAQSVAEGMREYQRRRLRGARDLVLSGQRFSRDFAAQAAA
jgi:2-polyprenyl-6-methoxyphenol hydroxylase-like FAD-dependent oxidoreductase